MTSLLLTATTTTADSPDAGGILAVVVLVFVLWRLALIALFPYAPHGHCKGSGKNWRGGNFRPCRGCKGTGRKLRLGRRIWKYVQGKETAR